MSATNTLADAVQRSAERSVVRGAAGWLLATVTATHAGGTVDVTTATGPVPGVRRMKSYTSPTVGDVVFVATHPNGNWVVIGALATS